MSKDVTLTTPDTTLEELKNQFGAVSGLPVVKSKKDKTLVGVVLEERPAEEGRRRPRRALNMRPSVPVAKVGQGAYNWGGCGNAAHTLLLLSVLTHLAWQGMQTVPLAADHVDAAGGVAAGQQGG